MTIEGPAPVLLAPAPRTETGELDFSPWPWTKEDRQTIYVTGPDGRMMATAGETWQEERDRLKREKGERDARRKAGEDVPLTPPIRGEGPSVAKRVLEEQADERRKQEQKARARKAQLARERRAKKKVASAPNVKTKPKTRPSGQHFGKPSVTGSEKSSRSSGSRPRPFAIQSAPASARSQESGSSSNSSSGTSSSSRSSDESGSSNSSDSDGSLSLAVAQAKQRREKAAVAQRKKTEEARRPKPKTQPEQVGKDEPKRTTSSKPRKTVAELEAARQAEKTASKAKSKARGRKTSTTEDPQFAGVVTRMGAGVKQSLKKVTRAAGNAITKAAGKVGLTPSSSTASLPVQMEVSSPTQLPTPEITDFVSDPNEGIPSPVPPPPTGEPLTGPPEGWVSDRTAAEAAKSWVATIDPAETGTADEIQARQRQKAEEARKVEQKRKREAAAQAQAMLEEVDKILAEDPLDVVSENPEAALDAAIELFNLDVPSDNTPPLGASKEVFKAVPGTILTDGPIQASGDPARVTRCVAAEAVEMSEPSWTDTDTRPVPRSAVDQGGNEPDEDSVVAVKSPPAVTRASVQQWFERALRARTSPSAGATPSLGDQDAAVLGVPDRPEIRITAQSVVPAEMQRSKEQLMDTYLDNIDMSARVENTTRATILERVLAKLIKEDRDTLRVAFVERFGEAELTRKRVSRAAELPTLYNRPQYEGQPAEEARFKSNFVAIPAGGSQQAPADCLIEMTERREAAESTRTAEPDYENVNPDVFNPPNPSLPYPP